MKIRAKWALLALTAAFLAAPAAAQDVFVYPEKGQNAETQQKDQFECMNWAKGQTGFDPTAMPQASSAPPQQSGSGVGGTAVRGAAVGAIAGKITGVGGGKGAGAGAAAGGMIGGMRRNDQRRQQDQWAKRESDQYMQRRSQYNRAYGACLEGRDYSVR